MSFKYKDLLGLRHLTKEEILFILEQAKGIKSVLDRPIKQTPILRGKTIANLFFEPSTRTRVSFEMATKLLGSSVLNININMSSVQKGESLFDMIHNLVAMKVDGFIIRHKNSGAPHFVAKHTNLPVINAGDGFHEHPTQGLLDIYTMIEAKGSLENKTVVILGDIMHSRVARSNIWGLTKLGAKVIVCGPPTLIPADIHKMGVEVSYRIDEVLAKADFINTLRIQYERQDLYYFPSIREYKELFGLTKKRLKRAKNDLIILHPGPINRGLEIDSEIVDGPKNVILNQVTNGVAIRMAVLYILFSKGLSYE